MRFLKIFQRDHEALERAKKADRDAESHLQRARRSAAWAHQTLAVNHLTERFYSDLRHGGKP